MISRYAVKVAESIVSGRWWLGQKGGDFELTQADAQHGRCTVCASSKDGSGW